MIETKSNSNDIEIIHLESVDSTNSEAKRLLHASKPTPFVVCANSQTNGRGRLSRSFYSPKDTGLYMSYALSVPTSLDPICITTRVAVAVAEVIEKISDEPVLIKWVNDILIADKKVCGILTEGVVDAKTGKLSAVIIGIGINLSTKDFPEDIQGIAGSVGISIDKDSLIMEIVSRIDNCLCMNDEEFIKAYRAKSNVLGKKISYTIGGETKFATAIDIDGKGGLIIENENGDISTLFSGEITVRTL